MKFERLLELVVFASCFLLLTKLSQCQDIIFPGDEEYSHVSGGAPVTERKPLRAPERCPENMLLWPDDGPRSAWVCDCRPRFVYFPINDTCHEVFQRGPCPPNHYVYLDVNQTIPKCIQNTCKQDGYVPFKGACHKLRAKGGPCGEHGALNVNETTFQLECFSDDLDIHVIIDAPHRKNCPKGSRRSSIGVCKLVL